jgi:hypothetical protein
MVESTWSKIEQKGCTVILINIYYIEAEKTPHYTPSPPLLHYFMP